MESLSSIRRNVLFSFFILLTISSGFLTGVFLSPAKVSAAACPREQASCNYPVIGSTCLSYICKNCSVVECCYVEWGPCDDTREMELSSICGGLCKPLAD